MSFIYSKAILFLCIYCTLCAGVGKHFAIFSLPAFRNQFSLVKVAKLLYHTTINNMWSDCRKIPQIYIKLGQLTLKSALGRNTGSR